MAARWRVDFPRHGLFWIVEASSLAVAVKRALDKHDRRGRRTGTSKIHEIALTARKATPEEFGEWDASVEERRRAAQEGGA